MGVFQMDNRKEGKRIKLLVIIGVLIILLAVGGQEIYRWNTEWTRFDSYFDMNIERIVSVEASTKGDESIAFVVSMDESNSSINYLPPHYIVRSRIAGRNRLVHRENDGGGWYSELRVEHAEAQVFNALTGELARIVDVLELLEEVGEDAIEGYRLERVGISPNIYEVNGDIMLAWVLHETPREDTRMFGRDGMILSMNYRTGELEVSAFPRIGVVAPWIPQERIGRLDEKGMDFEVQMSIFGFNFVREDRDEGRLLAVNGFDAAPGSPTAVSVGASRFSGIVNISLPATSLPEESDNLYSRFPGLRQFIGQEDLRVRIILAGYPSAEEILEMLMEDGQEITFEGLVLCSSSSIDGERHEINSFEDYFRLVNIMWWEDDEEGLLE
jgi:hypothetical protein